MRDTAKSSCVGRKDVSLGFELFPDAPYSSDIYSDYSLFPSWTKLLGGNKFAKNEEVKSLVNGYFEELDKCYYKHESQALLVTMG